MGENGGPRTERYNGQGGLIQARPQEGGAKRVKREDSQMAMVTPTTALHNVMGDKEFLYCSADFKVSPEPMHFDTLKSKRPNPKEITLCGAQGDLPACRWRFYDVGEGDKFETQRARSFEQIPLGIEIPTG